MTFEEMQTILAGIVANQSRHDQEMAEIRASQARTEASQAKTEAIANSNARAIEAVANQQAHDRGQLNEVKELQANTQRQLIELAQITRQIGESSDRRLTALEDRQ
jgi:hypothetical protein